jgi:phosphate transport system substrate-binding protein
MAVNDTTRARSGSFPEGDEYNRFVKRRQRIAKGWHGLFFAATLIGIIALVALLLDVANDAFGYVAIQNAIDEEALIVQHYKDQMLNAPRTLASEDDQKLAENIAKRPTAVGFFGYAFYKNNADQLTLLSVDGVQPNATTVESGEYPLARPLFIYSTQPLLQEKPQVAAFVNYTLQNANQQLGEIGYFPISQDALSEAQDTWSRATGLTQGTVETLYPVAGEIQAIGSSTVAPIVQRMAEGFSATVGQDVAIQVDSNGTDAGIRAFCQDRQGDLLNASRAMASLDLSLCQVNGRQPVEFRIANDGIPVVVSAENDFLTGVTNQQLRQIFTTAGTWSDVDPAWPAKPILHYIPSADSGTLDFFVGHVFGTTLAEQPQSELIAMITANVSSGRL